jgi:hypothetical protein
VENINLPFQPNSSTHSFRIHSESSYALLGDVKGLYLLNRGKLKNYLKIIFF